VNIKDIRNDQFSRDCRYDTFFPVVRRNHGMRVDHLQRTRKSGIHLITVGCES
jgi:hypothetical protein